LATTRLFALHINKGKTIAQTITDRTDYAENPDKTRKGELVTGYQCDPRTVDAEFLLSKDQYAALTGRDQGRHDVLAYHIRQAFKPGEITPEQANQIGRELAMRFNKGRHAFIVATHIDRKHIHNHIIFNSTTLDCLWKFDDPKQSGRIIRRISDQICLENGLSVIENPKPSRGHYGTWLGDKKEPTWTEKLEHLIDKVLAGKPADFDDFLKQMEAAKCRVSHKKLISFCMEGQKRPIRLKSLKGDYTEDAICERISGARIVQPREKVAAPISVQPQKFNLLIDIQNSLKAQNNPGYERWAKLFNLKQMAQTLLFLQENGLTEIEKIREKAQGAKDSFNVISGRIQAIDSRLKEIPVLQKHIGAYVKTKDVYAAYKKSGYSKKYLTEHEGAIADHKAAKKFFDEQKLEKLPTFKMLQQEFAALTTEKKKLYAEYHPARKYMQEILVAKQNAEQFLKIRDGAPNRENDLTGR